MKADGARFQQHKMFIIQCLTMLVSLRAWSVLNLGLKTVDQLQLEGQIMKAMRLTVMAAAMSMSAYAGGVHAVADYCGRTAPTDQYTSTYTATQGNQSTPETATIYTADVTFGTSANLADDCYGIEEGNPGENLGGLTLWDGNWEFLLKDDQSNSAPAPNDPLPKKLTIDGVEFTFSLSADVGETGSVTPSDWLLTVTPKDKLPILMDLVIVLKAAPAWAAYFFDNQLIEDSTNDGTFVMRIKNNGGNIAGLSGLSVYVRDYSIPDGGGGTQGAPEPGVLLLMGAGLLGLGVARRRKSA